MKYFSYNLKEHEVYMIEDRKAVRFFRRANDSSHDWYKLDAETASNLRPLCESKKMIENDWESKYCWELPYGEVTEFKDYLKSNFNGNAYGFNIKPYVGASIRISTHYTRNEVNEPYFITTARLPKDVLQQICELLLDDYVHQDDLDYLFNL